MAMQPISLIATHNSNDPFAPRVEFKLTPTEYDTYVYIDWEIWYHAEDEVYPTSTVSSNVYAIIGGYDKRFEFVIGDEDKGVEGTPCVLTGSTSVVGSRCIATGSHSIEKKSDAGQDIEIYIFFAFNGIEWYDSDAESNVILDVVEARDYMGINHIGFDDSNSAVVTYVVRYNKNHNDDNDNYGDYGTFIKKHGIPQILSTVTPSRDGYVFKGWGVLSDISPDNVGALYQPGEEYNIDASGVLYAIWAPLPTYTISYDTYGGSGTFDSEIKTEGETFNLPTDQPVRDGYIFIGWAESFENSEIFESGSAYVCECDITLYAVWFPVTYTISYDVNGGKWSEETSKTQKRYHGTISYITAKKPYRNGYKFIGWSDSSDGEVVYESGDECTVDSSFTLYAIWEESTTNIRNIALYRCDKDGNKQTDGSYVGIEFVYFSIGITTDVSVEWKCNTDYEEYNASRIKLMNIDGSVILPEKAGIFNAVFDKTFDSNKTYTFRIKVYDTGCEYNEEEGANVVMEEAILSNVNYFMDFKPPETADEIGGMAIGTESSSDGVLEIGFPTRFLGGILYSDLKEGVNFNELTIPNNFALFANAGYVNCPITTDGTLLVEPVGISGDVRHVVTGDKNNPSRYERYYTAVDSSWSDWNNTYIPDTEKFYTATKSVMITNGNIDSGQVAGAAITVPKGVYVITGEARIGTANLSNDEITSTPRNNQIRLYAKPDSETASMISMERNYASQSNFLVMTISTVYKATKTTTITVAKASSQAERESDANTIYQDTIVTAVRIA